MKTKAFLQISNTNNWNDAEHEPILVEHPATFRDTVQAFANLTGCKVRVTYPIFREDIFPSKLNGRYFDPRK